MKNRYKFLVLLLIFLYPVSVFAIPSLGVAPNSGGYYEGDPGVEYLEWFVDPENFVPVGSMTDGMDNDSFIIKWDWNGELTVWYGKENGMDSEDRDNDVYIATTSQYGDGFVFGGDTFDELVIESDPDFPEAYKTAATYKPFPNEDSTAYYGLKLGPVEVDEELGPGWNPAPDFYPDGTTPSPWANGEFYFFTASFTFPQYEIGDWIFALADTNENGVFDKRDEFSPPTTSTRIPEPANMLLLGTGLIVMAGLGRKRFFKK